MNTLDLLKASYEALCIAPRFKLNGNYKDSYELAGAIEDYLMDMDDSEEYWGEYGEDEENFGPLPF